MQKHFGDDESLLSSAVSDISEEERPHEILYYVMQRKLLDPPFIAYMSENDILFVKDLLENHPYLLDVFYDIIDAIIGAESVIDFHHIPAIILKLSHVLNEHWTRQKDIFVGVNIVSLVRFFIACLVCSDIFATVDVGDAAFMNVVETSLHLLQFQLPSVAAEEKACCALFGGIFSR